MLGSLNVIKSIELHDFEKRGYYNNIALGCPLAPNGYLLPFWIFIDVRLTVPTVTAFNLIRIDIQKNALDTYVLPVSYIDADYEDGKYYLAHNCNNDILSYIENTLNDTYTDGFYRFQILLSDEQTYYSEVFRINDFSTIEVIGIGDFGLDFGNDFSKP